MARRPLDFNNWNGQGEKQDMKRFVSLAAALLLLILAACGGKEPPDSREDDSGKETISAPEAPADPAQSDPVPPEIPAPQANSRLVFTYRGCPLPMNAEFSPLLDYIGEPESYFEAASCAFDGLDKTYTYSDVEIITYPDGDVDYISSVRLLSSAAATPEGITIGSSREDVLAAYGEEFEPFGDQYTYSDGDTTLDILFRDGAVISVEYACVNPLLA